MMEKTDRRAPDPNPVPGRGFLLGRFRLLSGLVLFAFATTHFLNHALGLVSVEAMQVGQDLRTAITQSLLGTACLLAAALVHFILGLAKFLRVRTLRLGLRNIVQLVFGLLIPVLMLRHVLGTRGVDVLFGIETTYAYALWAMWPGEAWRQAALMVLVWGHGCIGVHHWLGGKPWYRNTLWLWYGFAVLIPSLGYAGYVSAGRAARVQGGYRNPFSAEQYATIQQAMEGFMQGYFALLVAAVGLWGLMLIANRFSPRLSIRYANGPLVQAPRGMSLLDISRANRIPHASVCGGRARCSTCRVRVLDGQDQLPPASEREALVLRRVGAPGNVRLACQLYPTAGLTVSTLMPADMGGGQTPAFDQYHWGVERDVTLLFCDLRGFTKMSEGRLSYDVVFLLNQFLGRMAEAIEDSGGFVDKFMGDGIMAIFGMNGTTEAGARQAVAAARAMGGVLGSLNQSLHEELPIPLSMGIGLHTGTAILGRIGAVHRADSPARITALGETVNLASRLEAKTKDLGVEVIVSAQCAAAAGLLETAAFQRQTIDVRGLSIPIEVLSARRATDIPAAH